MTVLQAFLDRVSLTTSDEVSTDEQRRVSVGEEENKPQAVSLMTLHLAKGLEFPIVFLTGMEEGLLPHYRSLEDPDGIEEERRLCYVGITRGMRKLYLTRAVQRSMFSAGGGFGTAGGYRKVSRFFNDIPPEHLDDRSPNLWEEPEWERDEYCHDEPEAGLRKKGSLRIDAGKVRSSPAAASPQKTLLMVTSADDLASLPEGAVLLRDRPDQAAAGLKVLHPHFGSGVVASVEGNLSADPANAKVKVLFDNERNIKTLVLGKARLAICP